MVNIKIELNLFQNNLFEQYVNTEFLQLKIPLENDNSSVLPDPLSNPNHLQSLQSSKSSLKQIK